MTATKTTSFLLGLGLVIHAGGCGKDNSEPTDTSMSTTAIATDTTLSAGLANAHYSDALAASATQGTSAAALSLADLDQDNSKVTRTCTTDGNKAVVLVTGEVDRTMTKTSSNGRNTLERTMKGESSMKRTWSHTDDTVVACNSAGTAAQIVWTAPDKLKLEVEFKRSRERKMTLETPRMEKELSEKFSAEGKRTLLWQASSQADDTATSYFRTHSVSSEVKREMKLKNAKGEEKEIKIEIKNKEDAPLVVKVERLKSDNSIASRTFVSGTMIAKKEEADGTIETTYSNLKTTIASNECSLASGSASIVFKDATGATV
ncbi:MAG: hypothetical protein RIQ81_1035, partial [Pseudomonadota bacterium]